MPQTGISRPFGPRRYPDRKFGGPTFRDEFTDTAGTVLESHTPNVGTSWTKLSATTSLIISPTGNLDWPVAPDTYQYRANPDPPANCYLEYTFKYIALYAGANYSYVRLTDFNNGYFFGIDMGLGTWVVYSAVAGVFTPIATGNDVPTAGNSLLYRLELVGTTVTVIIGGVQKAQVTDTGNASGHAGVQWHPLNQTDRSTYTHFETGPL